MKTISFKPQFAEVIDNPALTDKEKLNFILENTLAHYNSSNRCAKGKESPGCSYHPTTINKTLDSTEGCAIGRLLPEEDAKFLDNLDVFGTIDSIIEYSIDYLDTFTLPSIITHYSAFFSKLQSLHDNEANWDSEGFRDSRADEVAEIKILINQLTE